MVLYFYGDDTFGSREYLKLSMAEFKKQRDPKGYNTIVLDGKKIQPDKLFAEINTAPFLAEKRMVVVENVLSSSDKEMLANLCSRVDQKKIPETTVVIFWQGEAPSKVKESKALHEKLAAEKYAREFVLPVGAALEKWIAKEVEKNQGKIDSEAVREIARNAEGDMWKIAALLDQLIAYKKGEMITVADTNIFLEKKIDDNVFNLVDAVSSGNRKLALKLLSNQRSLGEDDIRILGLFIWQFRILIIIADLLEREAASTSDQVAGLLKISPFVARKNFAVARKYSLSKLESIYGEILEMDLKIKTGRADPALLLDLFVAKI